jgi:cytochrome c553
MVGLGMGNVSRLPAKPLPVRTVIDHRWGHRFDDRANRPSPACERRATQAIGQKPPPRYTDALSHRAVAISESIRGLFVFRPGKRPMIRPLLLASCLTLATTALAQTPAPTSETAPAATAAPAPAASIPTPVGDAGRGKELTYTCQGCHGVTGYKNAYPNYHVPMIGGQSQQYLVNALTEYQQGTRKHPTMQAQASSFSAQDIADIAAFISSLK